MNGWMDAYMDEVMCSCWFIYETDAQPRQHTHRGTYRGTYRDKRYIQIQIQSQWCMMAL